MAQLQTVEKALTNSKSAELCIGGSRVSVDRGGWMTKTEKPNDEFVAYL